jgi:hypothetical protein
MVSEWQQRLSYVVSIAEFGQLHISPKVAERCHKINKQYDYKTIKIRYPKSKFGYRYARHFWFYSLAVVPAYLILKYLGQDPALCFFATNVIAFYLLFVCCLFQKRGNPSTQYYIAFLVLLTPALSYIRWPLCEFFTYCMLAIACLQYLHGRTFFSLFVSSVASIQMPVVLFFPSIIFFDFLVNEVINKWPHLHLFSIVGRISLFSLVYLISFLQPAFYYYHLNRAEGPH